MTKFTTTNIPFFKEREDKLRAQGPALDALADAFDALSAKDQAFAEDLLRSSKRGPLSDKQMYWVGKLTERATAPKPVAQAIDMGKINALFATATANGAKAPALRFGGFRIAPAKLHPGVTYVKSGDTYIGKIAADGRWFPKTGADAPTKDRTDEAFRVVSQFACDPVGAQRDYVKGCVEAKVTADCCFCNRTLTDAGSIRFGYGPICAEKYNLPYEAAGHGVKVSEIETDEHDGGRDEDGYGWEDRALAGAYSAA